MKSQAWKIAGMVAALCGSVALAQEDGKTNAPPGMKGQKRPPEEMLKRFDADGDGKLSEAERQTMQDAMSKRRRRPGGPQSHGPGREEIMKRFDTDGDGVLNETEHEAMRAERERIHEENMKRFDADGDGRLSKEERESMRETLRGERPAPPPEDGGDQ